MLSYEEERSLLQTITKLVAEDPSLYPKILQAGFQGTQDALALEQDLRAKAEFGLAMAYDMIPAKALDKSPAHAASIHKVLAESGAFKGTKFGDDLQLKAQPESKP